MEEGNVTEHRTYLSVEEEKRRRAQVVRPSVHGPLVRWISRAVDAPAILPSAGSVGTTAAPRDQSSGPHRPSASSAADHGYSKYGFAYTGWATTPAVSELLAHGSAVSTPAPARPDVLPTFVSTSPYPVWPPPRSPGPTRAATHTSPNDLSPVQLVAAPPASMPEETPALERVGKSFVIHELGQSENVSKPTWKQTMRALFGEHIRWDDIRVYVGRGRPYGGPSSRCLLPSGSDTHLS
jgi:hypothetical protein